jgi:hypothetical protein
MFVEVLKRHCAVCKVCLEAMSGKNDYMKLNIQIKIVKLKSDTGVLTHTYILTHTHTNMHTQIQIKEWRGFEDFC